eukprot:COSAG03_NODE_10470_length_645_cov_1.025455_1_plen_42_part_10
MVLQQATLVRHVARHRHLQSLQVPAQLFPGWNATGGGHGLWS